MNLFPRKLRLSKKPAKQLLWFWLWREMRASRGREIGIDAGCGFMQNYNFFETKKYIGIDVDQARLDTNLCRYPGFKMICAEIEDAQTVKGDVVLCVQVMHNRFFNTERTVQTVRAMCAMLRPGGLLIFNLGKRNMSFEGDVDKVLAENFPAILKRPYGALSSTETIFSPLLAGLMYLVPPLRVWGGTKKLFYICRNRN